MKIFLDANICLDLLDTTRKNSQDSIKWYLKNKDNEKDTFYFSSDFITTIFFILTQKRKVSAKKCLDSIDALATEITPCYLTHIDYEVAKKLFFEDTFDDFEDLLVLSSATRIKCDTLLTNDKKLLKLKQCFEMDILSVDKLDK